MSIKTFSCESDKCLATGPCVLTCIFTNDEVLEKPPFNCPYGNISKWIDITERE